MESASELIARLTEEYRKRQLRGEEPEPEDFRDAAGGHYEEFVRFLKGEDWFDQVIALKETGALPRPFGGYELHTVLGGGAVGAVYEATQTSLDRPVAIKLLHATWTGDEAMWERFRAGAQAAARIEHDHAVRVYDYGVVDGVPYLAMARLPGPSLQEIFARLRRVGPPPFVAAHHAVLEEAGLPGGGHDAAAYARRVAALLAGPADALSRYHENGFVHRDIKPSNLILDGAGRLVLTDFDLVRSDAERPGPAHPVGTPPYMSPEQWTAPERQTSQTDVYSLGVVLYEGLTLQPPFAGETEQELRELTLTREPDAPARRIRGAARLHDLARRALRKDPDDRPDASAFADALRAAARPRRRGALLALVPLLVVAVVAFAFPRTGRLDVVTLPVSAAVRVGDEAHGRTPLWGLALPPGEHRVALTARGFRDAVRVVRIERGNTTSLTVRLRAASVEDALAEIAREHGFVLPNAPPTPRATPEPRGTILFPRGRMRPADLGHIGVDSIDPEGLRVSVGSRAGDPVYDAEVVFAAGEPTPMPADLVRRLAAGGAFEIVLRREGQPVATATVEVVPDNRQPVALAADEGPRLARLVTLLHLQAGGYHKAVIAAGVRDLVADSDPMTVRIVWRSIEALGLEATAFADRMREHASR